ncbi:hypothetical protein Bca4012_025061 [Brassica carinata]
MNLLLSSSTAYSSSFSMVLMVSAPPSRFRPLSTPSLCKYLPLESLSPIYPLEPLNLPHFAFLLTLLRLLDTFSSSSPLAFIQILALKSPYPRVATKIGGGGAPLLYIRMWSGFHSVSVPNFLPPLLLRSFMFTLAYYFSRIPLLWKGIGSHLCG